MEEKELREIARMLDTQHYMFKNANDESFFILGVVMGLATYLNENPNNVHVWIEDYQTNGFNW